MKYTILNVDGASEPFVPKKKTPSLEEMQEIVGGYIERIRVPGGWLWINEEGRLHGLPWNLTASGIAGVPIVGRVLFAERAVPKRRHAMKEGTKVRVLIDAGAVRVGEAGTATKSVAMIDKGTLGEYVGKVPGKLGEQDWHVVRIGTEYEVPLHARQFEAVAKEVTK